MRWRDQRRSTNVEDRRGMGGGGRGIALGGGGLGMLVLVGIIYLCAGGDVSQLLNNLPSTTTQTQPQTQQQPQNQQTGGADDENKAFVSTVLASTEDFWSETFRKENRNYSEPKLVLFTNQVQSACGVASSSTGPFYCPGNQKLYLDFGFFTELKRQFNAPGDFAEAYVIAHEVGHHVQNLLGTMDKVQRSGNSNEMSIALELQADCLAGLWAAYAQNKGLVETGDAEEAIRAAAAVGDDMIQKRTQGYVVPDSFTHGSSEQRVTWFKRGFDSGDLKQCQTFR